MQTKSINVLRHAGAYLLARGIPGIISFLAIPLFTRLLEPESYGKFALVTTTVGLVNALVFQWLRLSFSRFLPAVNANVNRLKATVLTCQLLLIAVSSALVAGLCLVPAGRPWRTVAAISWLVIAALPAFELFCEQARALIQPRYYLGLQISRAILTTGLGALFIKLGMGWWGPLLGLSIGTAVPALYAFWHDWSGVRLGIDRGILLTLSRYGIPLSLTVALTFVIGSSDRYLIAYFLGDAAAGVYSVAVDFTGQTIVLLMLPISLAIIPLANRAWEHQGPDAAREQMRHNATLLLTVGIPAVLGLMILAPSISNCFLGKQFQQAAAKVIPIVALGTFLGAFKAYHLDSAFQFVHRTVYQVWIVLIAAVLNILLNLILIRPFGIIGSATGSVIAYLISMVLTAVYGRRLFALAFPTRQFLQILVAGASMAIFLCLVRDYRSLLALIIQISGGAGVYVSALLALNFLSVRTVLLHKWRAKSVSADPVTPTVL